MPVDYFNVYSYFMISMLNGERKSWAPWHHEGKNDTGIKKMVNVTGIDRHHSDIPHRHGNFEKKIVCVQIFQL